MTAIVQEGYESGRARWSVFVCIWPVIWNKIWVQKALFMGLLTLGSQSSNLLSRDEIWITISYLALLCYYKLIFWKTSCTSLNCKRSGSLSSSLSLSWVYPWRLAWVRLRFFHGNWLLVFQTDLWLLEQYVFVPVEGFLIPEGKCSQPIWTIRLSSVLGKLLENLLALICRTCPSHVPLSPLHDLTWIEIAVYVISM